MVLLSRSLKLRKSNINIPCTGEPRAGWCRVQQQQQHCNCFLPRISYCADDKAEKRFFSFIAKEADSEKHTCFVFVSDKLVRFLVAVIRGG